MKKPKDDGLWIRLTPEEKEEIKQEADENGFNMSEVARQRLFSDPIARIDTRLDRIERRVSVVEGRSLTIMAVSNVLVEMVNALFPEAMRISASSILARIEGRKQRILEKELSMASKQEPETL